MSATAAHEAGFQVTEIKLSIIVEKQENGRISKRLAINFKVREREYRRNYDGRANQNARVVDLEFKQRDRFMVLVAASRVRFRGGRGAGRVPWSPSG